MKSEHLTVIHPEFGTKPRVFYRNLDDALSHLVAGNVCEAMVTVDCEIWRVLKSCCATPPMEANARPGPTISAISGSQG